MCVLFIVGILILVIVLIVFIVNLRMFFLSMLFVLNFKIYGFWNCVGLGLLVIDEMFGVVIIFYLKGEVINDCWMYGFNIIVYLFWVILCVVGVLFGEYILNL